MSDLELLALELDSYASDPSLFIDGCIVTRDEADAGKTKPMPKKDYLYLIDRRFVEAPVLAMPKSRRMLVTWRLWPCTCGTACFIPTRRYSSRAKRPRTALICWAMSGFYSCTGICRSGMPGRR